MANEFNVKKVVNELMADHQASNEVKKDHQIKYSDKIMKYLKSEYDICELNGIEFAEFCRELMEMNIPFRMDIMNRLLTDSNEYGAAWKNRCVVVNGNEYKLIFDYLKVIDLKCTIENNRVKLIRNTLITTAVDILNDFENYLKDPSTYVKNDKLTFDNIVNLFSVIGIDTSNQIVKQYLLNFTSSLFCSETKILENTDYDDKLREWCGDYKWKLVFRASEHEYSAYSFHEYCNNVKGPTLVVIKSTKGWIFGGYTTQSWYLDSDEPTKGIHLYLSLFIINSNR